MKKLVLFSFLLFFIGVFGQNDELFEKGNAAYQSGNYTEAIDNYEAIIENGEVSAEVYFNLANAHYKLNHIAPSIYYYEKALQLDPNDEDIKNNLEFARNMAIDDIEEVERAGIDQTINQLISFFKFSTWAWLGIGFSFLFVLFFLLYYFSAVPLRKRIFFGVSMFSLLLCILSVIIAYQQRAFIEDNQFAIIFSQEAEVRDEPNMRGDSSFELHEGTKAKILEDYQEWFRIELANGAQGWIKKENLRKL